MVYLSGMTCGRWIGHRRGSFSYFLPPQKKHVVCILCCRASCERGAHRQLCSAALHTVFDESDLFLRSSGNYFSANKADIIELVCCSAGLSPPLLQEITEGCEGRGYTLRYRGYSETTDTLALKQNSKLCTFQTSFVETSCCVWLRDCQVCHEECCGDVGHGDPFNSSRQGPRYVVAWCASGLRS